MGLMNSIDKSTIKGDPKLIDLYRRWNRTYFHNKLPKRCIHIKFSPRLPKHSLGRTKHKITGDKHWYMIDLNEKYHNMASIWAMTLLHEMVHVWSDTYRTLGVKAFRNPHGPQFQAKMKELACRNAFRNFW